MSNAISQDKLDTLMQESKHRISYYRSVIADKEKELSKLVLLQKELEQNIRQLKKKSIVAMAHEFKKAKEDLAKAKGRVSFVRLEIDDSNRAIKETEKYLKKYQQESLKLLTGTKDNVINGAFGKKNGR